MSNQEKDATTPNVWQSPPLPAEWARHPRLQWRIQHHVAVWYMPNQAHSNEWVGCIIDNGEPVPGSDVSSDTMDGAEIALAEKINVKWWG